MSDPSVGKRILDGLANATPEDWARAWERARRQEVSREDGMRRRILAHQTRREGQSDAPETHLCTPDQIAAPRDLGRDAGWAFHIGRCRCGRVHLVARRVTAADGGPGDGRWYMGRFEAEAMAHAFDPRTIRRMLGRHERILRGGPDADGPPVWIEHDPVGGPDGPCADDLGGNDGSTGPT
ncbi:hypothetical protein [Roseospira navarrensis]|uniref:Uncharacterized protein n=1 Tax=Roseospira navarrensis TaxID=140058 RepID=A0A7X1ZIB0_9PROT|nr:hypothetical protein [Roseospira navarrensis]MQX38479.1 hypothetical protein [Roseospira navarrensis]